MRIALFGATGRLGGAVLAEALARGHVVTALLRDPARLAATHDRLEVRRGDLGDGAAVAGAIGGQEAVISCVGPGRLDGDLGVIRAGTAQILAGMQAGGVVRLVAVAAAGILQEDAETLRRDAPGFPPMLRAISAEHLACYELLRGSAARWTLACPPTMAPGGGLGGYRAERDYLPAGGERIALADAALFVLDELESGAFTGARVGIAE